MVIPPPVRLPRITKFLKPYVQKTHFKNKTWLLLLQRLMVKDILAISVHLKREQKYHDKVKAVIDSLTEAGVKLL
ncbi:50S ribosomal protein L18 [Quillaja saponaria]|uniref:50S ribosomal protein L18 n=1 Tax=Quillaja saponaria TaxID=32244 RepID=A0AAD7VF27_QUISA|nr:50S ribosomal protein L18 [Quillaja saponaria]